MKKFIAFLFGFTQGVIAMWVVGSVWLIYGYQQRDKDRPLSSVGYRSPWESRKKAEEKAN